MHVYVNEFNGIRKAECLFLLSVGQWTFLNSGACQLLVQ